MNLTYYKYWCLPLVSLLISANSAIAVRGSEISVDQNPIYLSKNEHQVNSKSREYTFKAPDNKTLSNSQHITAAQGYKVEVYGSGQELLTQVRDIEPQAFSKGDIIQVGIFSQQDNAEDMVRKLAVAGLWARMVSAQ